MTPGQMLLLADVILAAHLFIALFIAWSLPVIWLGGWLKWRFVRSPWFRFIHLGLMGVVFIQSVLGALCPLTIWEADLREAAGSPTLNGGETFVSYWMGQLLFHDIAFETYVIAYGLFFLAVLATFHFVPVRFKGRDKAEKSS